MEQAFGSFVGLKSLVTDQTLKITSIQEVRECNMQGWSHEYLTVGSIFKKIINLVH